MLACVLAFLSFSSEKLVLGNQKRGYQISLSGQDALSEPLTLDKCS